MSETEAEERAHFTLTMRARGINDLRLLRALERAPRALFMPPRFADISGRDLALPIDFSESPEAIKTNLATRSAARRLLRDGVTIVVFPAGGVATAENPAGKAEELPWKTFTARLIQLAKAAVLPVYFEGQNSWLFHFVSRYSVTVRLALMVSELRNFIGVTVPVHVGAVVPFEELASRADRQGLTLELYARVHQLAPGSRRLSLDQLRPRPSEARRRFPWDSLPRSTATQVPEGQ